MIDQNPNSGKSVSPAPPASAGGPGAASDDRGKALAIALELAKNAVRAKTLDDLQFILVNDTRALLEFDRSLLILHFEGKSMLAAASSQPKIERKADLVQRVNKLSPKLRTVNRALILFSGGQAPADMTEEVAASLSEYMDYSRCSCLMVVPLTAYDQVVGQLVLEFFGNAAPGEVETLTLMNMVPFFSSALAEKWMLAKPALRRSFFHAISNERASDERSPFYMRIKFWLIATVLVVLAFCIPVTLKVGGKAEAAPDYEYQAFVQMEGTIEKVAIKEGDSVKKDQVLAVLESKEIDYKIRESKRLLESYRTEMEILRALGVENPAKLAESQLVAIKSLRAKQELEFLNWQRQFLNIRSPVDGVILTKKVETLIGKRFKAGDPFCRIAPHELLVTEVFVKESDVPFVSKDQTGEVYFNYRPDRAYGFKVKTVAPKAETLERVGSVFRVRGDFVGEPVDIRPGMQGVAHINASKASLWFVLTRRLKTRLNELLLMF